MRKAEGMALADADRCDEVQGSFFCFVAKGDKEIALRWRVEQENGGCTTMVGGERSGRGRG